MYSHVRICVLVSIVVASSGQKYKLSYATDADDDTCPVGIVMTGRSIFNETTYPNQPNPRPVIGVFTQECIGSSGRIYTADCTEDIGYVSAGYVKWLEASGALVYIIPNQIPLTDLTSLMQTQLSGILIPGSGYSDKPYFQTASKHAVQMVIDGTASIPIFGTCMGFEIMAKVISGNDYILKYIPGTENVALPMQITTKGRMFNEITTQLQNYTQTLNITMNNHKYGIIPQQAVNGMVVLGTSVDIEGEVFVAAMEHESLPLYGTQWHPEKANFEFPRNDPGRINFIHQYKQAMEISQYVGNFFVEQARLHSNRFMIGDQYLAYSQHAQRVTSSYFLQNYYL